MISFTLVSLVKKEVTWFLKMCRHDTMRVIRMVLSPTDTAAYYLANLILPSPRELPVKAEAE